MAGRVNQDVSAAHDAIAVDLTTADQSFASGVRGLYVGGTGDVKADFVGGGTVTFKNVPVGQFAWQLSKVYKTGTTATLMVALL